MEIIDTHCHLDVAEFDSDRDQVLAAAHRGGVSRLIVPAIAQAGWDGLLSLCRREAGLFPALGLHPIFCEQHRDAHIEQLRDYVTHERPIAVGEIGLDFFIPDPDRERQTELFEAQLAIAEEFQLPVLVHVRKAHDEVLQSLKKFSLPGGIAHAFNGSLQQAEQYLELGFYFGFGGMLTYERSKKIRKLAAELPLERIVLETDAPDMTTSAHHGERNSPEYLPEVLAALAEVRRESPETLATTTTTNACRLFGL